jgi:Xaa-Pro dipeptidase
VLFVPADADPLLLVRGIERQNALDLTWLGPCETYQDTEDPLDVTIRVLKDREWERRRVGVELDGWFLTPRNFLRLRERMWGKDPIDASQIINRIRLVKSNQELTYMRQAARAVEASLQAAVEAIHVGVPEYAVAAEMHRGLFAAGSDYLGHPPLFGSGPRSVRAFVTWSDRVIQVGDPITIEPGGCIKRYHAVCIRTIHMGQPQDKTFLKLFNLSREGLEAGLGHIRAGVTSAEVDDALKGPARRAGFGHTARSRGGYSVGIGFPPDWGEGRTQSIKQGDATVLQENMTFHLLSNLFWEDKALISVSETVRVTQSEPEVLTQFSRELIIR